jgi:type I restriction enzyme M protein
MRHSRAASVRADGCFNSDETAPTGNTNQATDLSFATADTLSSRPACLRHAACHGGDVIGLDPPATSLVSQPLLYGFTVTKFAPPPDRNGVQMRGELLHCPIRGNLTVPLKAKDELTYTEEKRRIDAIKFLLEKGYPREHFKIETILLHFGSQGRNSFRTDIAVLDVPVSEVADDIEQLIPHIKLVAEIKRDSADADIAKKTQVYPALAFLHDIAAIGIYWDDIQQRLFYQTIKDGKTKTHETSIAFLPAWGQRLSSTTLQRKSLEPPKTLLKLFSQVEDTLHAHMQDQSDRFEVMQQLLLVKLFDEYTHQNDEDEMTLQDFTDAPLSDSDVKTRFEAFLKKAVKYYGKYLPKEVPATTKAAGNSLRSISALLAPVCIGGARRDVIQEFYMYFAKGVYKWDLAQYFTPTEVVDFIVRLVNPRVGDQIKDPACGSGDFLISTLHHGRANMVDLSNDVWGTDHSENAVQICVLNMVLNGDGRSNITKGDSLVAVNKHLDSYNAMLCNPPFGIKIVEKRFDVLAKFSMGHAWMAGPDGMVMTDRVLKSQETGLLFAELCVKQVAPGGRVGIILPNGYLGNTSNKYLAFREWLIRQARVVAIVGFPRFTFKKSGADVSASVVLVEKRDAPLEAAKDSDSYPFYAGLLESVGWSVWNKRAVRIYKRDAETGSLKINQDNEPLIDADFDRIAEDLYASQVPTNFRWLISSRGTGSSVTLGKGKKKAASKSSGKTGWSVRFAEVVNRIDLSLDPKRWCERVAQVRAKIKAIPHFALGEVVNVIPQGRKPNDPSALFDLVEIERIADGVALPESRRGWDLPDRAKHKADPGDLFVGNIWSSVGKWFIAVTEGRKMVVTNGMHRLKLKEGKEEYLLDLVAGFTSEAYRIQARAYTTGSDGLADLSADAFCSIVLPKVADNKARISLQVIVDALLAGKSTVEQSVKVLTASGQIPKIDVVPRQAHVVLV